MKWVYKIIELSLITTNSSILQFSSLHKLIFQTKLHYSEFWRRRTYDLPHLLQPKTANHAYTNRNGATLTEKWIWIKVLWEWIMLYHGKLHYSYGKRDQCNEQEKCYSTYEQPVCGHRSEPRPSKIRRKSNHMTMNILKQEAHERNALYRITGMCRKIRSILIECLERLRKTEAHISHESQKLFFWNVFIV